MSVLSPDALQERLQALIRPGDTLWWGQATAEPLTLTRAVVAQRHALAPVSYTHLTLPTTPYV